jgi:hypothetical protein
MDIQAPTALANCLVGNAEACEPLPTMPTESRRVCQRMSTSTFCMVETRPLTRLRQPPAHTPSELKFQYKGSIALTGLLACHIGSPPPPLAGEDSGGGRSTATGPPSSPSPTRGEGTARPDDEAVHRRSLRGGCLYRNFRIPLIKELTEQLKAFTIHQLESYK